MLLGKVQAFNYGARAILDNIDYLALFASIFTFYYLDDIMLPDFLH
jgi:hypothetical protein